MAHPHCLFTCVGNPRAAGNTRTHYTSSMLSSLGACMRACSKMHAHVLPCRHGRVDDNEDKGKGFATPQSASEPKPWQGLTSTGPVSTARFVPRRRGPPRARGPARPVRRAGGAWLPLCSHHWRRAFRRVGGSRGSSASHGVPAHTHTCVTWHCPCTLVHHGTAWSFAQ